MRKNKKRFSVFWLGSCCVITVRKKLKNGKLLHFSLWVGQKCCRLSLSSNLSVKFTVHACLHGADKEIIQLQCVWKLASVCVALPAMASLLRNQESRQTWISLRKGNRLKEIISFPSPPVVQFFCQPAETSNVASTECTSENKNHVAALTGRSHQHTVKDKRNSSGYSP